jgi:hypothetical protein
MPIFAAKSAAKMGHPDLWLVYVVVVLAVVFVRTGEFFEQVGVLNRRADLVVSASPFAEVDAAAAVGAEGEVFTLGENDGAAGGTAESFDLGHGV